MSLTGKLMMDDRQERELLQLTRLGNRLRSLGVLLAQSIPDVYANMQRESLAMSQETQALYRTLQHRIDEQLTGLFSMIEQRDGIHIPTLRDEKKEMRQLRASLEAHHGKRLSADQPNRVALYVYESMLLDTWMQVAYLSRRTAGLLKKTAEPSTQESLF
jgi:Na+/phosphate symporter